MTPPANGRLARSSEAATYLGLDPESATLPRRIDMASAAVSAWLLLGYQGTAPHPLVRQTLKEEIHQPRLTSTLCLSRAPVVSVSELTVDEVAVDAEDFAIAGAAAMLRHRTGSWCGEIAVTYVAGFVNTDDENWNVPDNVELATMLVIQALDAEAAGEDRILSESVPGAGSFTYADTLAKLGSDGFPVAARHLLAPYRLVPSP